MGGVNRGDRMMLAVLIGMGFVAAFNENTVNVALVYIQTEFDVSSVASYRLGSPSSCTGLPRYARTSS